MRNAWVQMVTHMSGLGVRQVYEDVAQLDSQQGSQYQAERHAHSQQNRLIVMGAP